ncbi:hypothetical protein BLA29_008133 [Euroglyphus maynei]|uniref:Uncharacterized protein n=1 Tax=Euroglyphus maynei TaxID=6958 RepID=A0A1Y3B1L5_EURMA|nr:hypothetical protein BLA29_008133 [Euroglyphus maynei]
MNKNTIRYRLTHHLRTERQFWLIDVKRMTMKEANIKLDNHCVVVSLFNHRIRIPLLKIDEIRTGQMTDNWITFVMKLKGKPNKSEHDVQIMESLHDEHSQSFSLIIKRDDHPLLCNSLDFYTKNINLFQQLIMVEMQRKIDEWKRFHCFETHLEMLEFLYRRYLVKKDNHLIQMPDQEIETNYRRLQRRFWKFLYRLNLDLDKRYFQIIMVC